MVRRGVGADGLSGLCHDPLPVAATRALNALTGIVGLVAGLHYGSASWSTAERLSGAPVEDIPDIAEFQQQWREVKLAAKGDLPVLIEQRTGLKVNPESLSDIVSLALACPAPVTVFDDYAAYAAR